MTEITTNPIDLTPENASLPERLFLEKAKRLLRKACIPPAGFKKIYRDTVIEPRIVPCLTSNLSLKTKGLPSYREIDLITGGLMVVYNA